MRRPRALFGKARAVSRPKSAQEQGLERLSRTDARRRRSSAAFIGWAALTLGWAGLSAVILVTGGLPGRFPGYAPPDLEAIRDGYREGSCSLREGQTIRDWPGVAACTIRPQPRTQAQSQPQPPPQPHPAARAEEAEDRAREPVRVLLWGDSFAAHLIDGIAAYESATATEVVQLTASGCPPVASIVRRLPPVCAHLAARALRFLAAGGFDRVIIAGRWDRYDPLLSIDDVARTLGEAARSGVGVVLVGRSPILMVDDPYHWDYLSPGRAIPLAAATPLEAAIDALEGVATVAPLEHLCTAGGCPATAEGRLVFADEGHLTPDGSRLLVRRIGEILFGPSAPAPTTMTATEPATGPAATATGRAAAATAATAAAHGSRDRAPPVRRRDGSGSVPEPVVHVRSETGTGR